MVKQILWVLVAAVLTALIGWLCFTWNGSRISFQFGELAHFLAAWKVILPLFLSLVFIIFLIKEFRNEFQHFLPNIFLITAGLLSILTISELKGSLILAEIVGGWTSYPPISALREQTLQVLNEKAVMDPALEVWLLIFMVFEVFIAFFLLIVGFKWGRSTRDSE